MSGQIDTSKEQIKGGSTALVPVSAQDSSRPHATVMAEAGFLTQLLSCRAGTGSFRRHRRAEPGIAIQLYRERADHNGLPSQTSTTTIKVA